MRSERALALALVLVATPATASEQYNRNLVPGARAASFGGAFTALADDPSTAFYNPAGLGDLGHDTFSLSTSLYALRQVDVSGGERKRGDVRDASDTDLFVAPVASALVKSFSEPGAVYPHSGGFFVSQMDVEPIDRVVLLDDSRLGEGAIAADQFAGLRQEDERTTLFGLAWGLRLNPDWALGACLLAWYHTFTARETLEIAAGQADFSSSVTRVEAAALSLGLRLSALWQATSSLRLGLTVQTPSLDTYGGGELHQERARFGAAVGRGGRLESQTTDDLEARFRVPAGAVLGLAWTARGRWRLSADVAVDAPVSEYTWLSGGGLGDSLTNEKRLVVDAALGAELVLREGLALRGGLFSQRSNVVLYDATQLAATDPGDRYGAVLATGIETGRVSIDTGLIGQMALGKTVVADENGAREADRTEQRLMVFVGASYWFDDQK